MTRHLSGSLLAVAAVVVAAVVAAVVVVAAVDDRSLIDRAGLAVGMAACWWELVVSIAAHRFRVLAFVALVANGPWIR